MELSFSAALVTAEDIYAVDEAADQRSITPVMLMERAGRALTSALIQRYPRSKVLIICGPGNNGGDGFVVARMLMQRGWAVTITTELGQPPQKGPAAVHAQQWAEELLPFKACTSQSLQQFDLIIDAGFGIGLTRPLNKNWQVLLALLHHCSRPIVAIDLPTGLGENGAYWAETPVKAELVLTLFCKKLAHVLAPGRHYCGEVVVCDIGLDSSYLPQTPIFYENGPALWAHYWLQTRPQAHSHKYERGHVLVYGGPQLPGAASLAALAAARCGAGLVSIVTEPISWAIYAAQMRAIMVRSVEPQKGLAPWVNDPKISAVVLGPGAISVPQLSAYLTALLDAKKPCVLDAEALTVMAAEWPKYRSLLGTHCVLTPHWGEFQRLFPHLTNGYNGTRLQLVQQAAQEAQATLVLKGAETLIAAPNGTVAINIEASPYLATAGSGDVLAGAIGAFLGQGLPPFVAAALAVWLHGRAGVLAGVGLIADDLPKALVAAQQSLTDQL